jgi:hypothetical protein
MDVVPKIGEIKNLKDLSKVIVLPLLCACYIFQSSFTVQFDDWFTLAVNESSTFTVQLFQVAFIFVSKTIVTAIICSFLFYSLVIANIYTKEILLPIVVLLLLTFGFVGIFASEKVLLLKQVKGIWFYSTFVVAFFLLAHEDEMHT